MEARRMAYPARITITIKGKRTKISSSNRNPRGVHFRVHETSFSNKGLTRAERKSLVMSGIEDLFARPDRTA